MQRKLVRRVAVLNLALVGYVAVHHVTELTEDPETEPHEIAVIIASTATDTGSPMIEDAVAGVEIPVSPPPHRAYEQSDT